MRKKVLISLVIRKVQDRIIMHILADLQDDQKFKNLYSDIKG